MLFTPALVTAVLNVSALGTRALWADEAYTALASTKSWSDLVTLVTRSNDAVHAVYYGFMHLFLEVFGVSELTLRIPSAVAMAAACLGVTLIGCRTVSARVGFLSGITFALLPITMDYGTEARSYAFSVALVAWTSWALARQADAQQVRVGGWIAYGLLLTLTGYVFMYAWLVSFPHAITLALSRNMGRRVRAVGFAAIATSAILLVPLWLIAVRQSAQVSWIRRDTVAELQAVATFAFDRMESTPWWPFLALVVIMIWGSAHVMRGGEVLPGSRFLLRLGWTWLLLPGMILVLVSLLKPTFTDRYLAFTAPAAALLLGLAMDQMRPVWRGMTLLLLVAVGMLAYAWLFTPTGRDGWGLKYQLLQEYSEPGDRVIFSPGAYSNVARFAGLPGRLLPSSFVEDGDPTTATWAEGPGESSSVWVVPFDCVRPEDEETLRESGYVEGIPADGTGPCTVQEFVRDPQSN